MRELKFRYWSELDNIWFFKTIEELQSETWGHSIDVDYQQFTGLLDNLGTEVYEGDIVAIYPPEQENHAAVEQTSFGWCFKQADGTETTYLSPELFRVIGNIYEDSELLTAPKQKDS